MKKRQFMHFCMRKYEQLYKKKKKEIERSKSKHLPPIRLIDADKLKEVLLKYGHPDTREWYYAEVAQFIDEAPTIIDAT